MQLESSVPDIVILLLDVAGGSVMPGGGRPESDLVLPISDLPQMSNAVVGIHAGEGSLIKA